jgi:hypothetical protein
VVLFITLIYLPAATECLREIDQGYINREGPIMKRIVPWHYEEKMNVLLIFKEF